MKIYVARHGQTDWNKMNILLGNTDKPLNDEGIRQAHILRGNIKEINFDIVISSDLKRAFQTACIACPQNDIIKDPKFRERNYGVLEGTTPKNLKDYWVVATNKDDNSVERITNFLDRIFSEMDIIINKYSKYSNVLIVTHHGVAMAIDAYFKNKYNYCFDNFILDNGHFNCYEVKEKGNDERG